MRFPSVLKTYLQATSSKPKRYFASSFRPFAEINANKNEVYNVGQPTAFSHPHLLHPGEVVPGITKEELHARRSKLLESIEAYSPQYDLHIVIIPASPKKYMTEKIPYVFRQDSDFMYLSGCLEPDSCLVLTSHRREHESVLFLRGKDAHAEMWDGPRTGVDQAEDVFGVERGILLADLAPYLRGLLKLDTNHYVWHDYMGGVNQSVYSLVKENLPFDKMDSPKSLIHRLRVRKSTAEQALMRRTCQVGSEAIIRTMKFTKPGRNESELFAKVDFESRMLGAQYLAYPPVVAAGPRANTIHYINNNQLIESGDIILMDAGCELNGYSSDITRTWPASGRWTNEQRGLYQVLYDVQAQLLAEVEKRQSLNQLFHVMCRLLGRGLRDLGLFKGTNMSDSDLAKAAYSFCPHHVSHYLGMDVHDTASVPRDIHLEPGMVFTVEPGIYVNSSNSLANPAYHGLGMRIEDDVLVTETGIEVLTAGCPKNPDDIENIVGTEVR